MKDNREKRGLSATKPKKKVGEELLIEEKLGVKRNNTNKFKKLMTKRSEQTS